MFVDTHCHLYKEYYENIDNILNEAKEAQVVAFFVAGCSSKSNEEVLELVKKYECVYGCLGIHPEEVLNYKREDILFLEEHIKNNKILAIGEIGLDYHYSKENREAQIELFESQMKIAEKYHMPVVIHSREATLDTIEVLKKYPTVKGVIHSFSGSLETARIYIKMGYKIGINGVVTFKNSHLKEILPEIYSSIVLETDSPYLTPHPYRGTQNSPKYIRNIADYLCEYLNISLEELAKVTKENIQAIFDFSY